LNIKEKDVKCKYVEPLSIHPEFLKKIEIVRRTCGEEAASLFIEEAKNLKIKLSAVKTEDDLERIKEELHLVTTIVLPKGYTDNQCNRSDEIFFEMPLCRLKEDYYYGRIMLFFPYLFKKNNSTDELKNFCENMEEKIKKINTIEIYEATYRG
jgi:hypothetical protein